MSTALALVENEVLDSGQPTLEELAGTANREHQEVIAAGVSMVEHAIAAGAALLGARDELFARGDKGAWSRWLDRHFDASHATACGYMRLAIHRDLILDQPTLSAALRYIRGLSPQPIGGTKPATQEMIAEAARLHARGLTYREIGPLLGLSPVTVRKYLDPDARRRYREAAHRKRVAKRAAEKAAIQRKRDAAVRKHGGSVAKCYAGIRRTLQDADRAHADAANREIRAGINAAISSLHEAEDALVRALGIS